MESLSGLVLSCKPGSGDSCKGGGGYYSDPPMAHMLRCLFFIEAYFDLTLSATHILDVENRADCVSHNEFFPSTHRHSSNPSQFPRAL